MTESMPIILSSFFILLREGFEAMLIAMLVFMYLDKMNAKHKRPAVFWGLGAGVVASLFIALAFKKIAGATHAHEELFEGSVMLIASGMLAYVAFFCHNAKQHVEGKVDKAIATGSSFLLSMTVFFAIIREGFEIVFGVRKKRKASIFKKLAYWSYYRLISGVASIDVPLDSGDFCLMSRNAVNWINQMPEKDRYIRGMRTWIGFSQIGVEYERLERFLGETKYSWTMLFKLAFSVSSPR